MTRPMKYHELVRLLRQAGFRPRPAKGDHEVWRGPGGISVSIVRETECSPSVTRDALAAIKKAKEAQ